MRFLALRTGPGMDVPLCLAAVCERSAAAVANFLGFEQVVQIWRRCGVESVARAVTGGFTGGLGFASFAGRRVLFIFGSVFGFDNGMTCKRSPAVVATMMVTGGIAGALGFAVCGTACPLTLNRVCEASAPAETKVLEQVRQVWALDIMLHWHGLEVVAVVCVKRLTFFISARRAT